MTEIHVFEQRAMATTFQVRIGREERTYAQQAAQAAFTLMSALETQLSRFKPSSDIARAAALAPGEELRLSEPTLACLTLARRMEQATGGAFCAIPAARTTQADAPRWSLRADAGALRCDRGRLDFDLGAIGKGFALDRMAAVLREWECPAHLLVAGGSSILAGEPPDDNPGWSCGLGEADARQRYWLRQASLSGSGLAVKGPHILDPRTGQPAGRQSRVWALCDTAAESDALSTAAMVLTKAELARLLEPNPAWLVFLAATEAGPEATHQCLGRRALPARA